MADNDALTTGRAAATTRGHATAHGGWAGCGLSLPGPGPEVPRDLYRVALEDALAYTTDRDGCGDCDRDRLCETHAARASRASVYQKALEQQMEAGS
jgi:hypothetical protein